MSNDAMTIEILEDGTIRVVTDQVSMANHSNAEQFLRFMSQKLGGETTRTRRKDAHSHQHHHEHAKESH